MKDKHKIAYMKCAEAFAECSPAKRLKVGSVLVKNNRIISCGYNALPAHIDGDCEVWVPNPNGLTRDMVLVTRPEVRHSERNCLKGLEKSNETSIGSIMFTTHSCCLQCAIDIVDAGVVKFIYKEDYRSNDGIEYLLANGVEVEKLDEPNN